MNESEQSLYDYLDGLIDKFNLKISVTESQVKDLLSGIAKKAVIYEFLTSLFATLIAVGVAVVCIRLIKGIIREKSCRSYILNFLHNETGTNRDTTNFIIVVCSICIIVVLSIYIWLHIIDMIECIAFPEKVVLEFMSNYIS